MDENTSVEIKKVIKPRAEDYTDAEMLKLHPYIFFPYVEKSKKLLVIGERGVGKTFSIRHSLLMKEKKAKMYIFRKNKKIEMLHDSGNDLVIYDDIHYICESVLLGETHVEFLLDLFKKITGETRRVILISDSPLCFYADQINNDEFNVLINKLGEYVHRNHTRRENVDFSARVEFPRISDGGIINIANDGNKKIEREALLYLLKLRPSPRELVNFINLFKNDITYEDVVEKIKDQISDDERYILERRSMPCEKIRKDVLGKLLEKFESYPDFKWYMKNFNMLRMQIIEQLQADVKTIPILYPEIESVSNWKKIMKLLKKREKISQDENPISIDWYLMGIYYNLLRNLKKQGKYSGDLSLFTGWKGDFFKEEALLLKINSEDYVSRDDQPSEADSLWNFQSKGIKRCDICEQDCIIHIMKKYYEKQYQEYSKIAELKRVMLEGKYHYE